MSCLFSSKNPVAVGYIPMFLILHFLGLVKAHLFYFCHSNAALKSSFSVAQTLHILISCCQKVLPVGVMSSHFCFQFSRQGAGAKLGPAGCILTGGQLPRCHRLNLSLVAADGDLLSNVTSSKLTVCCYGKWMKHDEP